MGVARAAGYLGLKLHVGQQRAECRHPQVRNQHALLAARKIIGFVYLYALAHDHGRPLSYGVHRAPIARRPGLPIRYVQRAATGRFSPAKFLVG